MAEREDKGELRPLDGSVPPKKKRRISRGKETSMKEEGKINEINSRLYK